MSCQLLRNWIHICSAGVLLYEYPSNDGPRFAIRILTGKCRRSSSAGAGWNSWGNTTCNHHILYQFKSSRTEIIIATFGKDSMVRVGQPGKREDDGRAHLYRVVMVAVLSYLRQCGIQPVSLDALGALRESCSPSNCPWCCFGLIVPLLILVFDCQTLHFTESEAVPRTYLQRCI